MRCGSSHWCCCCSSVCPSAPDDVRFPQRSVDDDRLHTAFLLTGDDKDGNILFKSPFSLSTAVEQLQHPSNCQIRLPVLLCVWAGFIHKNVNKEEKEKVLLSEIRRQKQNKFSSVSSCSCYRKYE